MPSAPTFSIERGCAFVALLVSMPLGLSGAASNRARADPPPVRRPNILFIFTDDQSHRAVCPRAADRDGGQIGAAAVSQ